MLKLVSWNIAGRKKPWRELAASGYDVALLQEACKPPEDLGLDSNAGPEPWRTADAGSLRKWRTAVVPITKRLKVHHFTLRGLTEAGKDSIAVSRPGTLAVATVVNPDTREEFTLASMYAAWERSHAACRGDWIYADAAVHRILSDISALIGARRTHRLIAAGDLNILNCYGDRGSQYWGARYKTVFDRVDALGLEFVGPWAPNGRPAAPVPTDLPPGSKDVPTYHSNRQKPATAARQLDFVFASKSIAHRVKTRALNDVGEWGPSDHCRVEIEVL